MPNELSDQARLLILISISCSTCVKFDLNQDSDNDASPASETDADADSDADGDSDAEGDADAEPVPCDGVDDCGGGPCVDGYCCDSPCDGKCEACDLPGDEGDCTPVAKGEDPDGECAVDETGSCGQNGTCDGKGRCDKYGTDTPCNDDKWCTDNDFCNGEGACTGEALACDAGVGNECCQGFCDEGAFGCVTEAGECADMCGNVELVTGRTCSGCGAAHAAGTCGGGTSLICMEETRGLCASAVCGGVVRFCTNNQGTWNWRTDAACDDGDDCTSNDKCDGSEQCVGVEDHCGNGECDCGETYSSCFDDCPCAGVWVDGYCWYATDAYSSTTCDQICADHGGCNIEGTRDYAGSGGTLANCVAVLAALGFDTNIGQSESGECDDGYGCIYSAFGAVRCYNPATSCGASNTFWQRACACYN
jgi:hypothetical protein